MELDRLDWRIIAELAAQGRATHHAVGEALGRSPTAVARRQKALEDAGVVVGYGAKLDLRRLGYGTIAHIKIKLESQRKDVLEAFEAAVAASPSIVRCDLMSGTDDYLVTVLARSLDDFADVHREELSRLPGVVQMESGFVLREIVKPRLPQQLGRTSR